MLFTVACMSEWKTPFYEANCLFCLSFSVPDNNSVARLDVCQEWSNVNRANQDNDVWKHFEAGDGLV